MTAPLSLGDSAGPGDVDGFGVGLDVEAGSPNPGGRIDSGRSWASAGMAIIANTAAFRRNLLRSKITADVGFYLGQRDLMSIG